MGSLARPVEPLTVALAVMSSAAAGIHGTLAPTHAREHWLLGVSFAAAAVYQLMYAFVVLVRPSRLVLRAGLAGNALIAAAWVASRTVGLPFGGAGGTPEPVGFVDGLTTAYELAIVATCATLLRDFGVLGWLRSGHVRGFVRTATIATAAFGIVALLIASAEAALDGLPGSMDRHRGSGGRGHALHLWLSIAAGIVVLVHMSLRPLESRRKERS
ncbi:hypothetical protein BH20ACT24_BH20ACT24_02370 [soil metagenome]